jgi:hypothetical protein
MPGQLISPSVSRRNHKTFFTRLTEAASRSLIPTAWVLVARRPYPGRSLSPAAQLAMPRQRRRTADAGAPEPLPTMASVHKLAAIEHVVAYETVKKRRHPFFEVNRLTFQLVQRICQGRAWSARPSRVACAWSTPPSCRRLHKGRPTQLTSAQGDVWPLRSRRLCQACPNKSWGELRRGASKKCALEAQR